MAAAYPVAQFQNGLASLDGSWVAVQVRSRQERAVAEKLELRGYESFAPLYLRHVPPKGKREVLFPGYVFCRYKTIHPFRIVETPWVIRIVSMHGIPQIVDENEIKAVQCVLQSGIPPRCWDAFVPAGTRVRVCAGPLSGAEGILIEVRNGAKLLISVSTIQKHIAVEVRVSDVELIGRRTSP